MEENFLSAIEESPTDLSLRLVYSDWLEETGDARFMTKARFLRLVVELSENRTDAAQTRDEILRFLPDLDEDWLAIVWKSRIEAEPAPWFDRTRTDIEVDSRFGEFTNSERQRSWACIWHLHGHQDFSIFGSGRRPTESQFATWTGVLEAFGRFELTGAASVPPPPPPASKRQRSAFRPNSLIPFQIGLDAGPGEFTLCFTSAICDRINLWPRVDFEDFQLVQSEWAP